ncbi:Hypothetical protein CINCED_3A016535 [Cinara cedri]|uniref:Uncharacterized protein n=1 Tax=Cinara cedri TaxID=506608 RepID=A0A5E4MNQ3_9HEMI|nr:Hypothetical protein CINCED_3A016535 [Cinara cedri]
MIPQCVVFTVKHRGGSVTVWGCFSGRGTGHLVKIDGVMKKEQYKKNSCSSIHFPSLSSEKLAVVLLSARQQPKTHFDTLLQLFGTKRSRWYP